MLPTVLCNEHPRFFPEALDGYRFICEVRKLPTLNGGQTPDVTLTALNRAQDRKKAIDAGFQFHS